MKKMLILFISITMLTGLFTANLMAANKADLSFATATFKFGLKSRSASVAPTGPYITLGEGEVSCRQNGRLYFPVIFAVNEANGKNVPSFRVTCYWKNPVTHKAKRVGRIDKLSIGGHQQKVFKVAVSIVPYTHGTLIMKLDDNNKVRESNNQNNRYEALIAFSDKIYVYPDFVVTSVKKMTKKPKAGKPVTVKATIKNVGYLDSKGFYVGFRWGGSTKLTYVATGPLARHKSVKIRCSHTFKTPMRYRVTCIANPGSTLKECNRLNNKKSIDFKVR